MVQLLSFLFVFILNNQKRKKMKKYSRLLLLMALSIFPLNQTFGQFFGSVVGNGNIETETRDVRSTFTGVKVSSGIDIILTQGNDQAVRVEADENIIENIVTKVESGVLKVYFDKSISFTGNKKVYVTMRDIEQLSTSSAGDIIGTNLLRCANLSLRASSAGDIKIEIKADHVDVDISSSGDIDLSGECESMDARLSSAGDLNASDLKTREVDINVSSAGDASIYVTDRLDAKASSAGDIRYQGDPDYVNAYASSAGSIRKR